MMSETAIGVYTPQQKSILMETVAKGCRPEEFLFMMELARKYQLDPFAKQIYCTKVGIIVARDGYLAIAHRHKDFNGINTVYVDDEHGNPISATTTVWRKGIDHPFIETAYWNEYAKDTDVWRKYKHAMLQKCSERMALSRAFCITGLYSDAELDDQAPAPSEDEPIPYTATVDGETVTVERMPDPAPQPQPKPEPKQTQPAKDVCPQCGTGRSLEPFERSPYEMNFDEHGLGTIPPGLCKDCITKLWKERTEAAK